MVGIRLEIILLPEPGGPIIKRLYAILLFMLLFAKLGKTGQFGRHFNFFLNFLNHTYPVAYGFFRPF